MSTQVDRMVDETPGGSGSKRKPAPTRAKPEAEELGALLREVGAKLKRLNDSGQEAVASQSLASAQERQGELLEALTTLLGLEREKLELLGARLDKLEGLYNRELSLKRRAAAPALWWHLALNTVLGAVLTACLLFSLVWLF